MMIWKVSVDGLNEIFLTQKLQISFTDKIIKTEDLYTIVGDPTPPPQAQAVNV